MKSFITSQFTVDKTEHAATPLHFSVIHFPALPCLQSSAVLNLIICFTPVIETERLVSFTNFSFTLFNSKYIFMKGCIV